MTTPTTISRIGWLAVGIGFFLTGFAALVGEVCWIRKSALAFGSTSWALALVLAIFFFGLALGSYLFGRKSHMLKRPLSTFGLLELGVGVWFGVSPILFPIGEDLYGFLYSHIPSNPVALTVLRATVLALLMLPATILMGGSLPVLCSGLVNAKTRVVSLVGILYGLNTLGGATGAAVCGFALIPILGVNASLSLAAGINVIVGLVVLGMRISTGSVPSTTESLPEHARTSESGSNASHESMPWQPRLLTLVFGGIGFVAVANEVLWARFLSLWLPNTIYTVAITLTVVLVGIVIGSLLASMIPARIRGHAWLVGIAQATSGIATIWVTLQSPTWWGDLVNAITIDRQLIVVATVMLVPSVLSGLCFPLTISLATELAAEKKSDLGSITGTLTSVNLLGGIVGSLVTGFILLPELGIHQSLLSVTGLSVGLGIATLWILNRTPQRIWQSTITVVIIAAWMAIPWLYRTQLPQTYLSTEGELVDFREGRNANVSVVKKGAVMHLEINRMWQGQSIKNHQVFAAHIPAMLHPKPEQVLVIGLGTGQTAGAFLSHPITRLDCLEIEDGLIDLIKLHFAANWMDDPRVHTLIEDGRNFVANTPQRYDIISIEVGQIYRPRIAAFYTLDFYQRLIPKLNPDGMVCQFMPIEFFGLSEFKTLVATFCKAFPKSMLWYNTSELLLIGCPEKLPRFEKARFLNQLNSNPQLQGDFLYSYWSGTEYQLSRPESFVAGFLCGTAQLQRISEGGDIYRDDRPYLEYLPMVPTTPADEIVSVLQRQLTPLGDITSISELDSTLAQRIRTENLNEITARILVSRAEAMEAAGQLESTFDLLTQAVRLLPSYPKSNFALADFLQAQGDFRSSISFYSRGLVGRPNDRNALARISDALYAVGDLEQARTMLLRLIAQDNQAYRGLTLLGLAEKQLGLSDEATEHLKRSLDLDPNQTDAMVALAALHMKQGRTDDGLALLEKLKKVAGKSENLRIQIGWELGQINQHELAIAYFQDALSVNPNAFQAKLGIANVMQSKNEPEQAQQIYRELLASNPELAEARIGLAYSLQSQKQFDSALVQFNEALRITPGNPMLQAAIAWILATHPDSARRDPQRAISLAESAWERTGQRAPQAADALAAAYAAGGQFDKAIAIADKAIAAASESKMASLAQDILQRKVLYQNKQPYIQP